MSDTGEDEPQQPRAPRDSHLPPPSLRTSQQRSERVKLRRALGFLGMTLVAPGSVQLAAGNKKLGRTALRIWVVVWALLLLLGIGALVWRSAVISLGRGHLSLPETLVSPCVCRPTPQLQGAGPARPSRCWADSRPE